MMMAADPMLAPTAQVGSPVLDPVSRATEVLFGLIMVLTFTASFNAAEAARADVRLMLIAALGCNLAWGLIDAAMYMLSVRAEKAIGRRTLESVRSATSSSQAHRQIAQILPAVIAETLDTDELERIRLRLLALEPARGASSLEPEDFRAAGAVFLLVFLATLPVAVPFVLMDDPGRALWLSHAIAIASLFLAGHSLGRHWNQPWRVGLAMVAIGVILVLVALALGG